MMAVEMRNISKRFGNILAEDAVSFHARHGEIHALVGENGAGKSTLMNILYGIHSPDSGDILVNQKGEKITTPFKAISLGIGMVHQHFMLIPSLSVAENIVLGKEPVKYFEMLNFSKAEQDIEALSEQYHLNLSAKEKIESLSVGLQQRVEILKILYRSADILIFDEPTAVLTPQESEELFKIFTTLKKLGKTIIFITHKLNEVMNITDRVTVMRRGKVEGIFETQSTNEAELTRLMVGREISTMRNESTIQTKEDILVAENVSADNDKKLPALKNVSFSIRAGEILGIAAVEGNGQSELVQVLTNLRQATSGNVTVHGKNILYRTHEIPIAHIPEDRLKYGVVLDFSVSENLILGRHLDKEFSSVLSMHEERITQYANELVQRFDVRPANSKKHVKTLSGGNQQKVVVAREISKNASVIIASQPTRGLDINAQDFVHRSLLSERDKGKAILLVSSDLSELLSLSNRIAVMYEGEIVFIVNAKGTSERTLGMYMTGALKKAS